MYEAFVPKEIFLTKGIGRHKEKLASFEEALRDAKIASFNLAKSLVFAHQSCQKLKMLQN